MLNGSTWPIYRTLLGGTTLSQSELGSVGNKAILQRCRWCTLQPRLTGLSAGKLKSILQWIHGYVSTGWPEKTYIHRLCVDTGFLLEDFPRTMTNGDRWWVRVKGNHSVYTSWWWLGLVSFFHSFSTQMCMHASTHTHTHTHTHI